MLKKTALQAFLDAEDPDIVCFNEIKTDDQRIAELKIMDFIPKRYI